MRSKNYFLFLICFRGERERKKARKQLGSHLDEKIASTNVIDVPEISIIETIGTETKASRHWGFF